MPDLLNTVSEVHPLLFHLLVSYIDLARVKREAPIYAF